MRIICIGGGPASLYFSLLAKKQHPDWHVEVHERNPENVTWGFGVVFSDETMTNFRNADAETHDAIYAAFSHWDDIEIHARGETIRSTGHGFAGMHRLRLLQILEQRARFFGVEIRHESDVGADRDFSGYDLVVAADGITSVIRQRYTEHFGTEVEMRPNRFCWLGSDKNFDAFTFYFQENASGLWRAHCYRYMPGYSTFIVETTDESFRRSGLEVADEATTLRYVTDLFRHELGDSRLISNNSVWRAFPHVVNKRFYHNNIVLLGDALHSAHFSIGSGTKLAMEDAIALADSLTAHQELPQALAAFQLQRQGVVESLQRAARVSMLWFEEVERYWDKLQALPFAFSLLTRSLRINHENLKTRDPALVHRVDRMVAEKAWQQSGKSMQNMPANTPAPIFTPFRLRDMVLENRIVVSPMCMYSAVDGTVNDWHLVHLGSRAIGGAGLILTEGTAISAAGRISPGCAGMYAEQHIEAWRRVTEFVHSNSGARIGIQLCHAGRKASTRLLWQGMDKPLRENNWPIMAPSPIAYSAENQIPRQMEVADMEAVQADFVAAAQRADAAGFDVLELHAAHGYLISSFLSPLTNKRQDKFGGSVENRLRFPLQVFTAMRSVWPEHKPMSVRLSATDWHPQGLTIEDCLTIVRGFKESGCDIIDVSAGQVVENQNPVYGRLFQTPFSTLIRMEAGVATMTVGNIQSYGDANSIIAAGRADLCVLGRAHLYDPYWTRHAATALDWPLPQPDPYKSIEQFTMHSE